MLFVQGNNNHAVVPNIVEGSVYGDPDVGAEVVPSHCGGNTMHNCSDMHSGRIQNCSHSSSSNKKRRLFTNHSEKSYSCLNAIDCDVEYINPEKELYDDRPSF